MMKLAPAGLVVAAVLWHVVVYRSKDKLRLVKPNFNKSPIMASYGIVAFGYAAALVGAAALLGYQEWATAKLYLSVMGAMWSLGALDDLYGSRDVGGFAGHFKKLIFERKLTTGALKAIGGGAIGILAGYTLSRGNIWVWVGSALLIPLAANTINLLDLRPGRAVAVFFVGLGVICIPVFGRLTAPWVIGITALVALVFGIVDSRGRAMMGDAWSNVLGAALGLTIALDASFLIWPSVILMIAIQLYSEKRSISKLIETNRVLRFIDRRLGVR